VNIEQVPTRVAAMKFLEQRIVLIDCARLECLVVKLVAGWRALGPDRFMTPAAAGSEVSI
jgi:hypothetical protein